jgi:hypothetical protein
MLWIQSIQSYRTTYNLGDKVEDPFDIIFGTWIRLLEHLYDLHGRG